jgi:hypothetical protein
MSFIMFGGVRYQMERHAVFCKKCGETVESKSVHDYKMCSCGSAGVDGGPLAGNHILGNLSDMEPRSVYSAFIGNKKIWLPDFIVQQQFRESAKQNLLS